MTDLQTFFELQIQEWPLAKQNYEALANVRRRPFQVGDFEGYVQFNPGRAVSTLVNLDKNVLKKRECFLCRENRPEVQQGIEILPGWELLLNPYPILPSHYTIVGKTHSPQLLNVKTGMELTGKLPGMVVFFNESGAGASAPDHIHFQAVDFNEVPLIKLLDREWHKNFSSLKLPFNVVREFENEPDRPERPVNAFFWTHDPDDEVKAVKIERRCHRPDYFFKNPPLRRAFSPGALDIAGILITPFEEDFLKVTPEEIEDIYRQVCF